MGGEYIAAHFNLALTLRSPFYWESRLWASLFGPATMHCCSGNWRLGRYLRKEGRMGGGCSPVSFGDYCLCKIVCPLHYRQQQSPSVLMAGVFGLIFFTDISCHITDTDLAPPFSCVFFYFTPRMFQDMCSGL